MIDDGISEEDRWRLVRQVVEGLNHIHSQGKKKKNSGNFQLFQELSTEISNPPTYLSMQPEM